MASCICLILSFGYFLQQTTAFTSSAEENEFVVSLLKQTTNSTPHSDMLRNTVGVYMDLYQLLGIEETTGIIDIKIWLCLSYGLPHLAWDPDTVGVEMVTFKEDTLWAPDIVFFDTTNVLYDNYNKQTVWYDGTVIAKSAEVNLKFTCNLSSKYFPFDTQECRFRIGQWLSPQSMYRLGIDRFFTDPDKLDLSNFKQSGQWSLREPVPVRFSNRTFKRIHFHDTIEYTFIFDRDPIFYTCVLVIPCAVLGLLSILCFVIPVESGEKVSLGITILLAQIVELLVLSEILPPTKYDDFPILGFFIISLVILDAVSVLLCVVTSTIFYTPPCRRLPSWVIKLISSSVMDYLFLLKLPEQVPNQGFDKNADVPNEQVESAQLDENADSVKYTACNGGTNQDVESLEMDNSKWKVLASFIDRVFLICYSIVMSSGIITTYYLYSSGT